MKLRVSLFRMVLGEISRPATRDFGVRSGAEARIRTQSVTLKPARGAVAPPGGLYALKPEPDNAGGR